MTDPSIAADRAVVARYPSCRILVVGDLMLDEYVYGAVRRISPEAPVPVVTVQRESHVLGGAANVAVNVAGLGARGYVVGVVGEDDAGRSIHRMLKEGGIGTEGLVVDAGRPTTRKTRVVAHGQQVVRVDRESMEPLSAATARALADRMLTLLDRVDGVVLSDYRKGVITREIAAGVISAARHRGKFVAVDPKQSDFSWYGGCTVITPNKGEAEAALGGVDLAGDASCREAAHTLLRKGRCQAVLLTRGEEGMTLVERGARDGFHVPAQARQVFDVTGAGDTVIGTLAVSLAAGASLRQAAVLANRAAGVVVAESGTAPITAEKLTHAIRLLEMEEELGREEAQERLRHGHDQGGVRVPRPPSKRGGGTVR
jgi:D-beta-D-heptose 7-phosphate kinase/D-beta-D-heptose 1-phosphate adenosyltransferase